LNIAEEKSSKKVTLIHVAEAIKKVDDFHIKPTEELDSDLQGILELVKNHGGKKIGDIYTAFQQAGGDISYKSFQRRIAKLKEARFISTEKISGKEGNTTIVHYSAEKKLTEF